MGDGPPDSIELVDESLSQPPLSVFGSDLSDFGLQPSACATPLLKPQAPETVFDLNLSQKLSPEVVLTSTLFEKLSPEIIHAAPLFKNVSAEIIHGASFFKNAFTEIIHGPAIFKTLFLKIVLDSRTFKLNAPQTMYRRFQIIEADFEIKKHFEGQVSAIGK